MLEIFQAAFFFLKLLWLERPLSLNFSPFYMHCCSTLYPNKLLPMLKILQYQYTNVCTTWYTVCHTGNCFGGGGGGAERYSRWFGEHKSQGRNSLPDDEGQMHCYATFVTGFLMICNTLNQCKCVYFITIACVQHMLIKVMIPGWGKG